MPAISKVMILDRDHPRTLRLMQMLRTCKNLKFTLGDNKLIEATERFAEEPCDIIFISHEFPTDEILDFLKKIRNNPQGKSSMFLMLCKGKAASFELEKDLKGSVDALVFEPFGTETVLTAVESAGKMLAERTAQEVKRQAEQERQKIQEGLVDVITFLDACAHRVELSQRGFIRPRGKSRIQEIVAALREINPALYQETAIELLIKLSEVRSLEQKKVYNGGSRALREKMQRRELLQALDKINPPGGEG